MTEKTILSLLDIERDFYGIATALRDMQQRLSALPVRHAAAAARDLRRTREALQQASARMREHIDTAAALAEFLEPAPF